MLVDLVYNDELSMASSGNLQRSLYEVLGKFDHDDWDELNPGIIDMLDDAQETITHPALLLLVRGILVRCSNAITIFQDALFSFVHPHICFFSTLN